MTSASNPEPSSGERDEDLAAMGRAMALAASVRTLTSPNPWVGCVVVAGDKWFEGATEPLGGAHAEVVALRAAGELSRGATLYTTLEPCAHAGRTGPCADAIAAAGVARVVVAAGDPDREVSGRGIDRLRSVGITVEVGVEAAEAEEQLAPYLAHRRRGRPWVVLKLAASLDGRIAAPDGSSKWLTGSEARADAHRLRAESDAVLVGAGTVRRDDPELTVRLGIDADPTSPAGDCRQPLRVVLGAVSDSARVQPAVEMRGELTEILDQLGSRGVLQLLVEGGAHVAHAFHHAGLVDRYVVYYAPVLFGGDEALSMFAGPGAPDMDALWRGRIRSVNRLGGDLRVEFEAA
ncbi:MAG: bifunctional diaminohydroxyphosphoribosylaminopyrimidine deaminase/5-amino-6-(5-phosphoribosylamino)uracil reductase RibD [Acidimicrobiales bacterium]